MKVVENRDELFKKESKAYFIRGENNRSRYDDWRKDISSKGYVRSDSYPNFFRTQYKSNYLRYSLKVGRQNSNFRSNSRPGYNQRRNSRPGNNVRPESNVRPGSNARPGGNNVRPGNKS